MVACTSYLLALLATGGVWLQLQQMRIERAHAQFDKIAQEQRDLLVGRMMDYEQVLLGAAGLFAASVSVERDEWRVYVDSLRLHETLPGVQGLGYAVMVPRGNKAAHEAQIRAEGFASYAIYPSGDRELYSSIIYLEPFSGRNLRAFAFDMYSEPVRRQAMQRAADTGDSAWSGKVTLAQEDGEGNPQPGFLVYSPIYAKNKPFHTVEERRAALLGFVYAPFRAWDLMNQLYQNPERDFELHLYDGSADPANLLYETSYSLSAGRFVVDKPVEIGGAHWLARFSSNAQFDAHQFGPLPWALLLSVLALETLVFVSILLDARNRRTLLRSAHELALSNREIRLLANLTQHLQNANEEAETFPMIESILAELFPGAIGACYLLNHSETLMQRRALWSGHSTLENSNDLTEVYPPQACWAFRRGQTHGVGMGAEADVCCEHVAPTTDTYVCIPMLAEGKVIGNLFLTPDPAGQALNRMAHYVETLASAADTIGLSLANLRLRNSLRDMAIRDSLTGLYNRRYMEESLEREIDRAQRQHHPVAVVMLDVDLFKHINDSFGHDAGDLMLRRMAEQLKRFRRGVDVTCRYGGEEFLLIMPEISRADLSKRLESLRSDIEALHLSFEGKDLPTTTVSMGVAFYPVDASEMSELIRLTDVALYRAKQNGRNRIAWFGDGSPQDAPPAAGVTTLSRVTPRDQPIPSSVFSNSDTGIGRPNRYP